MTKEQSLKKAVEQAKQGTNQFDALQAQIDLIVKFLTTMRK